MTEARSVSRRMSLGFQLGVRWLCIWALDSEPCQVVATSAVRGGRVAVVTSNRTVAAANLAYDAGAASELICAIESKS